MRKSACLKNELSVFAWSLKIEEKKILKHGHQLSISVEVNILMRSKCPEYKSNYILFLKIKLPKVAFLNLSSHMTYILYSKLYILIT